MAKLPPSARISGRLYFERGGVEFFKRSLIAEGAGGKPPADDPAYHSTDLVSAMQLARELGVHRRTLARRLAAEVGHPGPLPQFAKRVVAAAE